MSKNVTNILTNAGLNLPEQYTEAEFFEAGRFLANIEHGLQWAVGDWYNAIPDSYGDKKAACEKAGLDYKTANTYAKVAFSFKSPTRVGCLSFAHHQKLAIDALDDIQRTKLPSNLGNCFFMLVAVVKVWINERILSKSHKVRYLLSIDIILIYVRYSNIIKPVINQQLNVERISK